MLAALAVAAVMGTGCSTHFATGGTEEVQAVVDCRQEPCKILQGSWDGTRRSSTRQVATIIGPDGEVYTSRQAGKFGSYDPNSERHTTHRPRVTHAHDGHGHDDGSRRIRTRKWHGNDWQDGIPKGGSRIVHTSHQREGTKGLRFRAWSGVCGTKWSPPCQ